MAEKINIATLKINVDDVIKESVRLKKEIESLKGVQQNLDKSTDEGAASFARNEAELKNLSKAYKDNQNFAAALDAANKNLNETMKVEGKSTLELYNSRRQLNEIAKNIKGETQDELNLRDKLNEAIDAQTQKLREQQSDFNKNKDRIGEYKDSIIEAVNELRNQQQVLIETKGQLEQNLKSLEAGTDEYNNLSQALVVVNKDLTEVNGKLGETTEDVEYTDLSVKGLIESSRQSGGAFEYLKKGLKSAAEGVLKLLKASLSFIFSPIGAVLVVIAGAFLLIQNAMNRSEEATSKLQKAFSFFSGIVKTLLKYLEPLGEFLIDVVVGAMELLEKASIETLNAVASVIEFLGFDDAAKSVRNFTGEIEKNIKLSKDLVDAELEYDKAMRQSRRTQLEFQKQAEKLRQVRDDESKSISERIKANDELGAVLKKQAQEELRIAETALKVANIRLELDGATKETLDAQADALTEIADIQERIVGQESEQLVNKISLQKEASQKAIEQKQKELELFLKSQKLTDKSISDNLETERQASKKREEILNAELRSGLKTRQEYNNELKSIRLDLALTELQLEKDAAEKKKEEAQKAAEKAIEIAKDELSNYIEANKSKLDAEKFLTDEILNEEILRNKKIADKRKEFAKTQLENKIISEREYNQVINDINNEEEESRKELINQRDEALKEKKAIDAENELLFIEEQGNREFEVASIKLQNQYEAEIADAEKKGADKEVIDELYAARKQKLEDQKTQAQFAGAQQVFDNYAQLLGEQTAAGKAAAIASTLISTYQGAQQAFTSLSGIPIIGTGLGIAAATAAVLSGLKQVDQIRNTPTEFAKGAILKGNSHKNGGIPFSIGGQLGFEAEGGEALINKKSTAMFKPLLSELNYIGGGKRFASGGIAGISNNLQNTTLIDYDILASKIAEANLNLPAPKVSVTEINEVSSRINVIENIATE